MKRGFAFLKTAKSSFRALHDCYRGLFRFASWQNERVKLCGLSKVFLYFLLEVKK